MIDFNEGSGGAIFGLRSATPSRRTGPAGQSYYPCRQSFFAQPHSSHHKSGQFDFTNTDCHTLGKKF